MKRAKVILAILAAALVAFGCATVGQEGASLATAVVIDVKHQTEIADAEWAWIEKRHPGARPVLSRPSPEKKEDIVSFAHKLLVHGGRSYSAVAVLLSDGSEQRLSISISAVHSDDETRAQQGARANGRAAPCRGSSLTLGKKNTPMTQPISYREIPSAERKRLAAEVMKRVPNLRRLRFGMLVFSLFIAMAVRGLVIPNQESILVRALVAGLITGALYAFGWYAFGESRLRREIERLKNA